MKKFFALFTVLFTALCFQFCPVSADNTANLSGYGTATSNNYQNEDRVAMYAIDGIIADGSRWASSTKVTYDETLRLYTSKSQRTAWLAIEFEIDTEISSAKIYWHTECAALGHYKLQYSENGEEWTDISDASYSERSGDGSPESPYLDEITFDPVSSKHFRVEISAGETESNLGSIYEFELYGDISQYDYLNPIKKNLENNDHDTSRLNKDNSETYIIIAVIAVGAVAVTAIAVFTIIKAKNISKGGPDNE